MAWLYAPQTGGDVKKGTAVAGNKSRAALLAAKGASLPLPPNESPDLLALLWDVGPSMGIGADAPPINAQELAAWANGTGKKLTPWEFQTLLDMSHAYTLESQMAADPTRAAPWVQELTDDQRKAVGRQTKAMFRGT